jgi:S-sulfo-L-cysteine synthase (O-acetyl-L-serine-dependent)
MARYKTMEETIGNTPLVRLQRVVDSPNTVLVKLEGNNPAGSVKDRPAYNMILQAERRGEISPGDRLVEATSGNTGIALAMAAAIKGYSMTLVMPEGASVERRAVMKAYGAELILTPAADGMEGAIDKAKELERSGRGRILDQFANPDNPASHYAGTGPEIWRDTEGEITHFVGSMGTTGTVMGVSRFLKEKKSDIVIAGVWPDEGAKIPGIRKWPDGYVPPIFESERVDRILYVDEGRAHAMARRLAAEEGIFCGISGGGCIAAALKLAWELEGAVIVAVIPDRGDKYLSTGVFPA